jgi:hypothetical protein
MARNNQLPSADALSSGVAASNPYSTQAPTACGGWANQRISLRCRGVRSAMAQRFQ